jgi:hypothetical protein
MNKPIENIQLAFVCNKKLEQLATCDQTRYCASCNKMIFDFRESNRDELNKKLSENTEVCGIFSKEQLVKKGPSNLQIVNKVSRYVASLFISLKDSVNSKNNQEEIIYGMTSEVAPGYPGGLAMIKVFISNNIKYPKDAKKGKVQLRFIVGPKGKVRDIKIVKGLSQMANIEAKRLVDLLAFIPGVKNGKEVDYAYQISIPFNLEEKAIVTRFERK